MPALKGAEYLLDMLMECGLHELTWRDLAAWADLTGTTITSWEARAMLSISRTYTQAVAEYDGSTLPAPYQAVEFDREKVANQVRSALRRGRKR